MWSFETDAEYQKELDWIDEFVKRRIEPLDFVIRAPYDTKDPVRNKIIKPVQREVQERGLWACHLGPDLGGRGYGQVKLALMNEILGRTRWGPTIFGCQAPDTGNAEIIAHYGTPEQKARYLKPLLDGEVFSAFSMTEPQGGADPTQFRTRAVREGDEWIIHGEKFFTSNARNASFFIVMALTNPDAGAYKGTSMFLVPSDTPGITILRDVGTMGEELGEGAHAHIRYEGVHVPAESLLGDEGLGFVVAQTRLGGGRIHHAMRTLGVCNKAFEMMCERALSRETKGSSLAEKQLVQGAIADSWAEIQQFRLFVLYTAWRIDRDGGTAGVRKEIAASIIQAAKVLRSVVERAIHVHGALGVS
ncbi:MAG: acyl-CoA dehydrogenase family protein, partial [Actinomycetota bacterium]